MAKQIRITGSTQPRIRVTGSTQPPIDPAVVAAALGAERVGPVEEGGSPLGVLSRAMEYGKRSQAEATRREKVALSDAQMQQLGDLATALTTDASKPTTAQVATAVLSIALRSLATLSEEQRATLAQELTLADGHQPDETPEKKDP